MAELSTGQASPTKFSLGNKAPIGRQAEVPAPATSATSEDVEARAAIADLTAALVAFGLIDEEEA